jgi:CubicO group peptidase (beta-lactamase class C family)
VTQPIPLDALTGPLRPRSRLASDRPVALGHAAGFAPIAALAALLTLVALFGGGTVVAQTVAPERAELEAFLDERVPALLAHHAVPGAAVAVVRPGDAPIARGYGLADAETGRLVEGRTPFAVASVTKLLTWTAVMQLVEAGELSLDDAVQPYVDFALPERFGEPLRVWHLMAHATGFEDRPLVGLLARDPARLAALETVLAENVPDQVLPPGTLAAYSNYGAGVAALVVERVTGRSFETYVEEEILMPLGARDGSIRQPLAEGVAARVARGYAWHGGEQRGVGFVWSRLAPSGAWWASAEDAAAFMAAWLRGGTAPNGGRILDEGTVRAMRAPLHRHDPRLPGNAHGWWEVWDAGVRLIEHGGSHPGFTASLALVPEHGIGVFVATNSAQGRAVARALRGELLQRLWPGRRDASAAPGGDAVTELAGVGAPAAGTLGPPDRGDADLDRYPGVYQGIRHGASTIARLAALVQRVRVERDGDALVLGGERFLAQADGAFVAPESGRRLVFRREAGRVSTLLRSDDPRQAYRRLAWHETGAWHAGVALVGFATLMGVVLTSAAANRLARRRGRSAPVSAPVLRAGGLATVAFLAVAIAFVRVITDPLALLLPPGAWLSALAVASLIAAAAAGWLAARTGGAWLRREGTPAGRAAATVASLGAVALVATLEAWNVLGFRW